MKNPHANKILIPLVLMIWGIVMFRFFGGEDQKEMTETDTTSSFVLQTEKPDTFSLVLKYRDPFLDRLPVSEPVVSKPLSRSNKIPRLVKKSKPKRLKIPRIRYQGGVQKKESRNTTGIVQVENKIYTVQQGDSLAGMEVLSLSMNRLTFAIGDTTIQVMK